MNAEPRTQGDLGRACGSTTDPIEPFLNALAALLVQPGMGPQRPRNTPAPPAAALSGLHHGRS